MINTKRNFSGGINADDDYRVIDKGDYLNLENGRVGVNKFSKSLSVQNIPSSILKYNSYPAGTNYCIGTARDFSTQRIFWFNWNSNGSHGIYCYDITLNITYIVLLSSQTESGLNFSKTSPIDRNARVANGLLIFTDNNNEPQEINIEAGIKLNQPGYGTTVLPYATNIPYTTLTLIKRPPIYRIQAAKQTDSGFKNNYIKNNAYQFTYRYQYKNYKYSCLSAFSQLMPYNAKDDTFNFINVLMNFSEDIPDYVLQIDFCVRYGNTGKTFIIKSYNKNNVSDLAAMQAHNANTTQLGFAFYDNLIGIALDDITANTSFHAVALLAKTLEVAKNRVFLANLLKGYDTPTKTSLTTSLSTFDTGGGTYSGEWKTMSLHGYNVSDPSSTFETSLYYVWVASPQQAYYFHDWKGGGSPPAVNADDADFSWNTEIELAYYIIRNNIDAASGTHWSFTPTPTFNDDFSPADVIVAPTSISQFFKSSSTYQISIAFFDRYRRKCGVVTPFSSETIDDRTADQTEFASTIGWTLSNTNALVEIPVWAYYYQIHISKNQTTAFFEQIFANGSSYAVKNADGTYTYGSTYALNSTYAIAIDLSALTNKGLGYAFNEGDLARIYFSDDTNKTYSVLGVDGNYVLLSPEDIGTLGDTTGFFVELYTPYKPSTTEPMYETGDVMPVLSPATNSRVYSILAGSINGDAYAIERDNGFGLYFAEAMSPNDNVWQFWQTDRGWINLVDTVGQQRKETAIDYSDTFINGTKTNGLNIFEPLNTKDIGLSTGSIQKLQLAGKQEEDGSIMLILTEEEPLSAYLGEVNLYKAAEQEGLVTTDEIIGTINPLRNGFGTINPESTVEYNGVVWWWDILHGVICQYSNNGVDIISNNKVRRFSDMYSKRYIEQGKAAIETLCGFSAIHSCVDPSSGEVMFILPQVEASNFPAALPSYTSLPSYASSMQNRFDIYDGQAKTLAFNYERNRAAEFYQWLPDAMEYMGNKLFGFKDGTFYLLNEGTSYNTVFGVQYPLRLCFPTNIDISVIEHILRLVVEGNGITPNYTVVYTNYPNEQITDLTADDFTNKEGVLYAKLFRDRLSPNVSGTAEEKMMKGDKIKSNAPLIMVEFQVYDKQLVINFADTGSKVSTGHNTIIQKA